MRKRSIKGCLGRKVIDLLGEGEQHVARLLLLPDPYSHLLAKCHLLWMLIRWGVVTDSASQYTVSGDRRL